MIGSGDSRRGIPLQLYVTDDHPCSYLSGLTARTLFVDPRARLDAARYELLLGRGFRRSGAHVYRPECAGCRRCVAVRLPVKDFAPDRSQRRNIARNAGDLTLQALPARFDPEHYRLYAAYLGSRHAGGDMSKTVTPESYQDFLLEPWGGETQLLELRLGGRLAAVAVTDLLPWSLSAVYTFFEPELSGRGLGNQALLCQIAQARSLGLDHLYLGYWIEECRKMAYKDRYRPLDAFIGGRWRRFGRGEPVNWREQ